MAKNSFDFLSNMFGGGSEEDKLVTSRDLKVALMGAKRERRKKQLQLKRIGNKKTEYIERIKKARRDGSKEDVDFIYDEMDQLKIDASYARREDKVLRLEMTGLQRYLRSVERLEKTSNKGRIRDLMVRMQNANLQEQLQGQTIDEEAYLDSLGMVMDDVKAELEDINLSEESEKDNGEKERFLANIDQIIAAEEEGNEDMAEEKQEELKSSLEKESPEF
jgi:hypothetical protein